MASPGVFNEDTLRSEIVRMWGEHGAHVDVFDHILKLAKKSEEYKIGLEQVLKFNKEPHIEGMLMAALGMEPEERCINRG